MANIVIIIILALGVFSGIRRGLLVQLIHTVGFILSYIFAILYFKDVAKMLDTLVPYPSDTVANDLNLYHLMKNVQFDKVFYHAVAFILILFIGWVLTRLVAAMMKPVTKIPVVKQVNTLGGGLLGFLCHWIGLFFILSVLSTLPISMVQNIFTGDSLATFIVKHTPIFSQYILDNWFIIN